MGHQNLLKHICRKLDGQEEMVHRAAHFLYHGILLNHVDIKSFVKTKECRRKTLLSHFETEIQFPNHLHLCCDNCFAICKCGLTDCGQYTRYPSTCCSKDTGTLFSGRKRNLSDEQKKFVENALIQYHKELRVELANTTAKAEIKTLTNIRLMLGFSEHQITQVLNNLHQIFTMSDVYNAVEIWDKTHAEKILSAINSLFGDILPGEHFHDMRRESVSDVCEFDDELLDDWQEILQDNDMYDMIIENLSLSQIQDSLIDECDMSSSDSQDECMVAVLENIGSNNAEN